MKLSKIYREAAKRIDAGKNAYACDAIRSAGGFGAQFFFIEHLAPYPLRLWYPLGWFGSVGDREHQNTRVLALLFAAEIAKGEGR